MVHKSLFSSASQEWGTPEDLFNRLNERFSFTLDPCCTVDNKKASMFFTKEEDGLLQSWVGHRVFMNPPYGREIGLWVRKAFEEAQKGALVVCLLPARTDTSWWQSFCKLGDVIFLKGRLKFIGGGGGNAAPFPSAIVIFRGFELL